MMNQKGSASGEVYMPQQSAEMTSGSLRLETGGIDFGDYEELFEQKPWCCWKTKRRKRLTVCSLVTLFLIGLGVFFLFPRTFKVENMQEIRDLANRTEVSGTYEISGTNLPARLRNDNFYSIRLSALDLTSTLPDFSDADFQVRLSATDPSVVVEIAAHSSAVYYLNIESTVSTSAGLSIALQCGGNPEAFYLSNTKGTVTIDSILLSQTLNLDAQNAESSCLLIAG